MNNIIDLKKYKLDAILLVTPLFNEYNSDIYHITKYIGIGYLIIKKNKTILIVPEMEYSKAKKNFKNTIFFNKGKRNELLKENLKKCKNIGIQYSNISYSQIRDLKKLGKFKFKDIGKELLNIRSVKKEYEIKNIKNACKLCDEIFSKIINNFNFKTEKELSYFITNEIRKKGHEISFKPIVASAKNSSNVHHNPEDKIKKGFLLLDYGAKVNGYCSDMSRTIYVGNPSKREIEKYNKVLKTQEEIIKSLKINQKCKELHENTIKLLNDDGDKFIHGLGHGVGLDIHESPSLHPLSEDIIKENNVITIEPGIYFENQFGIRIEDTILIKKNKNEILTKSKKELIKVNLSV